MAPAAALRPAGPETPCRTYSVLAPTVSETPCVAEQLVETPAAWVPAKARERAGEQPQDARKSKAKAESRRAGEAGTVPMERWAGMQKRGVSKGWRGSVQYVYNTDSVSNKIGH